MAKFKVGDKVRVHYIPGISACGKRDIEGKNKEYIIQKINKPRYYGDTYIYDIENEGSYWWSEDELELVPLTVKEKKAKLYEYCRHRSCMGCPLTGNTFRCGRGASFHPSDTQMTDEEINKAYSMVFEQGEKDMKQFTKKDLKNGDVVKLKNGWIHIVCCDTGTLITPDGYNELDEYNEDLTYGRPVYSEGRPYDIVAVRRPKKAGDCVFDAFKFNYGELVYERKEVEEMTLEEVCKALGKEIKIVKK